MKTIIKILAIGLFLALIALGLISCGARKLQKSQTKEETKTELTDNSVTDKQAESNVKTTSTVKVDDKNQTITKKTTYEPQDNTKESSITDPDGKKTILNNTKKTVEETTQNNNTKSELVNNIDELKKEAVKEQKAVKQVNLSKKENSVKNVEKKQFNWLGLWWVYLLIAGVLYFFRKSIPILKLIP